MAKRGGYGGNPIPTKQPAPLLDLMRPPVGTPTQPGGGAGGAPSVISDGRAPIGVQQGFSSYAADAQNIFQSQPSTATVPADAPISYFAGDEWKPASLPIEQIVAIQRQLQDAGLLDPPYQLGVWDSSSRDAYKSLLAYANARGVNSGQALSTIRDAVGRYGSSAAQKARPLTVTLTNPADIANLASDIAVRTIGRRLTDQESSTLAQAYNALERQYQTDAYTQAGSGLPDNATGGKLTQPPNASTYAESEVRAQHPEEATEMSYIRNFDAFRSLLASSSSKVRGLG